jgi:hypothetical protein
MAISKDPKMRFNYQMALFYGQKKGDTDTRLKCFNRSTIFSAKFCFDSKSNELILVMIILNF